MKTVMSFLIAGVLGSMILSTDAVSADKIGNGGDTLEVRFSRLKNILREKELYYSPHQYFPQMSDEGVAYLEEIQTRLGNDYLGETSLNAKTEIVTFAETFPDPGVGIIAKRISKDTTRYVVIRQNVKMLGESTSAALLQLCRAKTLNLPKTGDEAQCRLNDLQLSPATEVMDLVLNPPYSDFTEAHSFEIYRKVYGNTDKWKMDAQTDCNQRIQGLNSIQKKLGIVAENRCKFMVHTFHDRYHPSKKQKYAVSGMTSKVLSAPQSFQDGSFQFTQSNPVGYLSYLGLSWNSGSGKFTTWKGDATPAWFKPQQTLASTPESVYALAKGNLAGYLKKLKGHRIESLSKESRDWILGFPNGFAEDRLTLLNSALSDLILRFQDEACQDTELKVSRSVCFIGVENGKPVVLVSRNLNQTTTPVEGSAMLLHELGHFLGDTDHSLLSRVGDDVVSVVAKRVTWNAPEGLKLPSDKIRYEVGPILENLKRVLGIEYKKSVGYYDGFLLNNDVDWRFTLTGSVTHVDSTPFEISIVKPYGIRIPEMTSQLQLLADRIEDKYGVNLEIEFVEEINHVGFGDNDYYFFRFTATQ